MMMSLIIGYFSAKGGRYIWEIDRYHYYFVLASSIGVDVFPGGRAGRSQEQNQKQHYVGQVIFVGSRALSGVRGSGTFISMDGHTKYLSMPTRDRERDG